MNAKKREKRKIAGLPLLLLLPGWLVGLYETNFLASISMPSMIHFRTSIVD
jgi:hypothetical protein